MVQVFPAVVLARFMRLPLLLRDSNACHARRPRCAALLNNNECWASDLKHRTPVNYVNVRGHAMLVTGVHGQCGCRVRGSIQIDCQALEVRERAEAQGTLMRSAQDHARRAPRL